jgi:hypothetical protein
MENKLTPILFVAYQFPPRGGPGVHRSISLVKHLRSYGYEPIVLTIREEDIRAGAYDWDDSLLKGLPEDLKIYRVPAYEPLKFIKRATKFKLFRLFWFFFYPRLWERPAQWPAKTLKAAEEIVRKHNIQLVYTSSGPFSAALLGLKLKRSLGLKWVADLRDPFTDGYQWDFPSKFHWLLARYFEKLYLSKCDHLIVNTPTVKRLMEDREVQHPEKISAIGNGY